MKDRDLIDPEILNEDNEKEFGTSHLASYQAAPKFKSIRRAMKRGKVTPWGEIIPKRPFNNSKRSNGRKVQQIKEEIYGKLRRKNLV